MSPLGVPLAGADAIYYSNKGDLHSAAMEAIGVLPAAQLAGQAYRGTAGAKQIFPEFGDMSKGFAGRRPEAPSSKQLLDEGVSNMRGYSSSGQTYPPSVGQRFVDEARSELRGKSNYLGGNPNTYEAIQEFENKVLKNPYLSTSDVDEFHKALSNAAKKGEPGSMQVREKIYDYLRPSGETGLERGVQNYSAGKRGERVDDMLEKSLRRTDANRALEGEARKLVESDKLHRGFLSKEIEALDAARAGTPAVRGLEGAANLLTGQEGGLAGISKRLLPMSSLGGGIGFAVGGPVGAGIGGAIPGIVGGTLGATAAPLRREAVTAAGEAIRQRSPLFEDVVKKNAVNPYFQPGSPVENFTLRNAITQILTDQDKNKQDELFGVPLRIFKQRK
jgi:hypothetical protein